MYSYKYMYTYDDEVCIWMPAVVIRFLAFSFLQISA